MVTSQTRGKFLHIQIESLWVFVFLFSEFEFYNLMYHFTNSFSGLNTHLFYEMVGESQSPPPSHFFSFLYNVFVKVFFFQFFFYVKQVPSINVQLSLMHQAQQLQTRALSTVCLQPVLVQGKSLQNPPIHRYL